MRIQHFEKIKKSCSSQKEEQLFCQLELILFDTDQHKGSALELILLKLFQGDRLVVPKIKEYRFCRINPHSPEVDLETGFLSFPAEVSCCDHCLVWSCTVPLVPAGVCTRCCTGNDVVSPIGHELSLTQSDFPVDLPKFINGRLMRIMSPDTDIMNDHRSQSQIISAETGVSVHALNMGMGTADYFEMMRYNIDTLKEALG